MKVGVYRALDLGFSQCFPSQSVARQLLGTVASTSRSECFDV